MRSTLPILLVLALLTRPGPAQDGIPGEQRRRTLPAPVVVDGEVQRSWRNEMRLLRAGSPQDRLRQRARLMREAETWMPLMRGELRRRNHFAQTQVLLVLLGLRAREALPELMGLAGGELKGATGWAALALGATEDPRGEEALLRLARKGPKRARPHAFLALGRLRGPRGAVELGRALDEARGFKETIAILLGLGIHGAPESFERIVRHARSAKDRIRRAATAALGLLDFPQAREELARLVGDEDAAVRRLAWEGLARISPGSSEGPAKLVGPAGRENDTRVLASRILCLGVAGGEAGLPLLARHLKDRREALRVAAAAALLHAPGRDAERLLRPMLGDRHRDVRLTAFLVAIARSARTGAPLGVLAEADDSDERVRRGALAGAVYLQGRRAAAGLRELRGPAHRKDVRRLALEWLQALERHEESARGLAGARLQTLLDETGGAASWNLLESVNGLVMALFDVENARPMGGAGDAPGGPSAAARAAAAAARRLPTGGEDLYLHFRSWPYVTRRPWSEF